MVGNGVGGAPPEKDLDRGQQDRQVVQLTNHGQYVWDEVNREGDVENRQQGQRLGEDGDPRLPDQPQRQSQMRQQRAKERGSREPGNSARWHT